MTQIFTKTLYKKEQIWKCEVFDYKTHSTIIVTFGKNGGKLQTKTTDIYEGKNVGKINETTHQEQAILEAESKVNKQKDKLYTETPYTDKVISMMLGYTQFHKLRPMLAQSYDKHSHKITFPCYVQPKLDGLRCLSTGQLFNSRQGKPFVTLNHLVNDAVAIVDFLNYKTNTKIYLDGELYSTQIPFQQIISGIKRDEANEFTPLIEYHLYDVVIQVTTFVERFKLLNEAFQNIKPAKLKLVDTVLAHTKQEITELHTKYVGYGFEGAIARNSQGLYLIDKRSYDLQKIKSFDDGEYEIVDYEIDKNDHVVFYCVDNVGNQFKVKPKGDNTTREEYTDNADDLIGKMLTVRYFGLTTGDNPVPRFPVGVCIRDYEN